MARRRQQCHQATSERQIAVAPVCTENPKSDHSGDEVLPGRRVN